MELIKLIALIKVMKLIELIPQTLQSSGANSLGGQFHPSAGLPFRPSALPPFCPLLSRLVASPHCGIYAALRYAFLLLAPCSLLPAPCIDEQFP